MAADPNARLVYSTGGEPVAEDKAAPFPEAAPGRVRLRLARRASDRVVTLISGLPGPPEAIARLLRELKGACGAGGTLKQGVIELQGDQRATVEAALRRRGIASKRAGG